jgi:HCOMODA/2-hydroxy-3-carboxy-muconic semialdehyde decarboxylase
MEALARAVRVAARAIGRAGLAHAYGHCSARLDAQTFLVCPPKPLALVGIGEPCERVPVRGELPDGVLGEVKLHQRVYARRASAGGVVRFMGPSVMALAALGRVPRIRHGFATYFAPAIGFWDDVLLVRNDEAADGAIAAMGGGRAVLMRGNGAVVCGDTIEEAVVFAWYLEDVCRIELAALSAGLADSPGIGMDVARQRAVKSGRIIERMWDFLTDGDPEWNRPLQGKQP